MKHIDINDILKQAYSKVNHDISKEMEYKRGQRNRLSKTINENTDQFDKDTAESQVQELNNKIQELAETSHGVLDIKGGTDPNFKSKLSEIHGLEISQSSQSKLHEAEKELYDEANQMEVNEDIGITEEQIEQYNISEKSMTRMCLAKPLLLHAISEHLHELAPERDEELSNDINIER